jgi:hypothetical protein
MLLLALGEQVEQHQILEYILLLQVQVAVVAEHLAVPHVLEVQQQHLVILDTKELVELVVQVALPLLLQQTNLVLLLVHHLVMVQVAVVEVVLALVRIL